MAGVRASCFLNLELLTWPKERIYGNQGAKTLQASLPHIYLTIVRKKSSEQRIHGGGISDQYKWRSWDLFLVQKQEQKITSIRILALVVRRTGG